MLEFSNSERAELVLNMFWTTGSCRHCSDVCCAWPGECPSIGHGADAQGDHYADGGEASAAALVQCAVPSGGAKHWPELAMNVILAQNHLRC